MACTNPATTEREPKQVSTVQRKPRILLAASGSVAAIKFANLCHCFSEWADVRAVATKASLHFIDRASMPRDVILYVDEDEWSTWTKIGDTVLHIELRIWADILVIAPLSANTLGKIAGGLCDNLLTSIVRAWDYSKPIFVAPAMNTLMWNNPFTERHLMLIDELGVSLIPPVTKRLACGDYGNGAMAEPSLIFSTVRLFVESRSRSGNHLQSCSNPFALPVHGIRRSIEEPLVKIEMLTPKDYIGPLMELAQDRRAEFKEMKFITEVRASLTYILPLAETLGEDQLCTLTCSSSLC